MSAVLVLRAEPVPVRADKIPISGMCAALAHHNCARNTATCGCFCHSEHGNHLAALRDVVRS